MWQTGGGAKQSESPIDFCSCGGSGPIIEADFLYHFGLFVERRQKCFFDSTTALSAVGSVVSA